jgi:hypothetical protein
VRDHSQEPFTDSKLFNEAARDHGQVRHAQGYTTASVVEESRMLHVSPFSTRFGDRGEALSSTFNRLTHPTSRDP